MSTKRRTKLHPTLHHKKEQHRKTSTNTLSLKLKQLRDRSHDGAHSVAQGIRKESLLSKGQQKLSITETEWTFEYFACLARAFRIDVGAIAPCCRVIKDCRCGLGCMLNATHVTVLLVTTIMTVHVVAVRIIL